jgi:hypothetical protein
MCYGNMQHASYNIERIMCAGCNMQCDAKRAACKMHIAMRKIEHATQHAAHSMLQNIPCSAAHPLHTASAHL